MPLLILLKGLPKEMVYRNEKSIYFRYFGCEQSFI
jgi:hypothetical protein